MIKNIILDIDGIYYYQEHLIKPDYDIYNLMINKFNLNKKETKFFADKEKMLLQQIK